MGDGGGVSSWEPHQGFINQLPVAKRLSLDGEGPPQQPAPLGKGGEILMSWREAGGIEGFIRTW